MEYHLDIDVDSTTEVGSTKDNLMDSSLRVKKPDRTLRNGIKEKKQNNKEERAQRRKWIPKRRQCSSEDISTSDLLRVERQEVATHMRYENILQRNKEEGVQKRNGCPETLNYRSFDDVLPRATVQPKAPQMESEKDVQRIKETNAKRQRILQILVEKQIKMMENEKPRATPPSKIVNGIQKKHVQDGKQEKGHKFRKLCDDTLREIHVQQYPNIMKSVGCLSSQHGRGTLFRVGSIYGMTAAHVVNAIINPYSQPKGDETRLSRDQVYVSFSEAGADQSQKFKLAGRVAFYSNVLDVALVEFHEESIPMLPPPLPLLSYDVFEKANNVAVVGYGHHKNDFKCLEHSVRVVDPESVPVSNIKRYLEQNRQLLKPILKCIGKDSTSVDNGYTGYRDKHHVLLNAYVGPGASGSPILSKDDPAALQVVGLYTCGYPNFYYQLPSTIQFPLEWTFEAGTKMSFIYNAMKSQNQKLAEDIFSE